MSFQVYTIAQNTRKLTKLFKTTMHTQTHTHNHAHHAHTLINLQPKSQNEDVSQAISQTIHIAPGSRNEVERKPIPRHQIRARGDC